MLGTVLSYAIGVILVQLRSMIESDVVQRNDSSKTKFSIQL